MFVNRIKIRNVIRSAPSEGKCDLYEAFGRCYDKNMNVELYPEVLRSWRALRFKKYQISKMNMENYNP
jgi:hypothetical protein